MKLKLILVFCCSLLLNNSYSQIPSGHIFGEPLAFSGSKVNVRLSVKLNNTGFSTEAYPALRQFFETLVKIQSEEPIEFRRL